MMLVLVLYPARCPHPPRLQLARKEAMIEELKKMPIATQQGQSGVDRIAGMGYLSALLVRGRSVVAWRSSLALYRPPVPGRSVLSSPAFRPTTAVGFPRDNLEDESGCIPSTHNNTTLVCVCACVCRERERF